MNFRTYDDVVDYFVPMFQHYPGDIRELVHRIGREQNLADPATFAIRGITVWKASVFVSHVKHILDKNITTVSEYERYLLEEKAKTYRIALFFAELLMYSIIIGAALCVVYFTKTFLIFNTVLLQHIGLLDWTITYPKEYILCWIGILLLFVLYIGWLLSRASKAAEDIRTNGV